MTLFSAFLGVLRSAIRKNPPKHVLYVILSRVKALKNLRLTEELTMDNIAYFKPDLNCLAEIARLDQIEQLSNLTQ